MFRSYAHQGGKMAIFSKKNSGKRPDRAEGQAKVILDESLATNATEDSPAKDTSSTEASAQEPAVQGSTVQEPSARQSTAQESAPSATTPDADAAAAEAKKTTDTDHEVVEPESIDTPSVVPIEHRFGIDDAIQLMRSLPADPNSALVVRVVRVTLSAVNVSVEEIVADATRKEARIKEGIAALEARIVDLEGQLGALRREITAHQADLKETTNVRERLHLADQYTGPKPPPTPIQATLARLSQTKPISS
jgi:hypothetical protein